MRNYDFYEKMDWAEFEAFACEVVQKRENIKLQTYKSGPDSGVDGFWCDGEKTIVVQAKRYKDFKSLYALLKREELEKYRG